MEASGPVTVVVARTPRVGRERDYEAWLVRAIAAARAVPGHLGAEVVPPTDGGRRYVLLFRYDALANLLAWEASEARRALLAEADALCDGEAVVARLTGLETWFVPPGGGTVAPPPRWKMALVSWAVAFPLIQLLGAGLGPVLRPLPALARGAIVGAAMVLTMTYAAMPLVTRALARWLYPPRRA